MASKGSAIEENNALMANGSRKGEPRDETFMQFLFNRQKGTCLGRTAKSWAQITIFYIIFYSLLAAFWIACLAIFLKTLDPNVPRFYGKGTIIGINPGLGYQPWLENKPDSTLIKFNIQDPNSYAPYEKALDKYFEKYQNTNNTRDCKGSSSNADEPEEGSEESLPACQFSLKVFEQNDCGKSTAYGFKKGKPCVVLSLNRLIGWRPTDYPPGSVPEEVRDRYKSGSIALHCDGTNLADKEHIGRVTYLPTHGIDGRYYPYRVMKNYHQPVAMVRFDNLPRNQLVLVECRAYALNIEHDISSRLGLVHFEILLENRKPTEEKQESR